MEAKRRFAYGAILISLLCGSLLDLQAQNTVKAKKTVSADPADVYVAGYYHATGANPVAGYVKNGVPVYLTDGKFQSIVFAIAVKGDDVYAAGMHHGKAVIWKNNVETILTEGTGHNGEAFSIAISGPDVYVAGYERIYPANSSSFIDYARCWKNGQPINLESSVGHSAAISVAVDSKGDVYVIGSTDSQVRYWKNGQTMDAIGSSLLKLKEVQIVNNAIYIAGEAPGQTERKAAFWKGGSGMTTLGDGTASSIGVDDLGNVHVAGYHDATGALRYWKNGILTVLSEGTNYPGPYRLVCDGSDVYITGGVNEGARYWKNGQPIILNGLTKPYAITVARRNKGTVSKTVTPTTPSPQPVKQPLPAEPSAAGAEEESEKFLALNKTKPGVYTTPSGLQYQVITQGNGRKPVASDKVRMQYGVILLSGEEVMKFGTEIDVDVANRLPGMVEGLQLMNTGSTYKFAVPSRLWYGNRPGGHIKPGSAVILTIKLNEILPR